MKHAAFALILFAASGAVGTVPAAAQEAVDFSASDDWCRGYPQKCVDAGTVRGVAALKDSDGPLTIQMAARRLQYVLPRSTAINARKLIEMNGWTGATIDTAIPENMQFRVLD
ncbi:hypothetical protein [Paracoccus sp. (in: a-proteobacteria)]|uniref:hypothetical protein n=1 Tax=Paracoccus sp. TaxID=267 RepID=UPI003A8C4B53